MIFYYYMCFLCVVLIVSFAMQKHFDIMPYPLKLGASPVLPKFCSYPTQCLEECFQCLTLEVLAFHVWFCLFYFILNVLIPFISQSLYSCNLREMHFRLKALANSSWFLYKKIWNEFSSSVNKYPVLSVQLIKQCWEPYS